MQIKCNKTSYLDLLWNSKSARNILPLLIVYNNNTNTKKEGFLDDFLGLFVTIVFLVSVHLPELHPPVWFWKRIVECRIFLLEFADANAFS